MSRYRKILYPFSFNAIVVMFIFISLLFACEKFEPERTVKLKTGSVTNVSYTTCVAYGKILDIGKKKIDQHGFCFSTQQKPTTEDNNTQLGSKSSTGDFSCNLTGLSSNTIYYVRAYAQNKDVIFYGDQEFFSTQAFTLPTITTTTISNITESAAQSGGNITDDGGVTVTARGVCWSTSQNPTTADSNTTNGSGTGSFTSSLTGLSPGTRYYVRAYATNSLGTAYGNEVSFTTITTPAVITSSASYINETSATVGGNVTDDGGATVTERGIYYSTSASPETTGTKLQVGSGTGTFSISLTGLSYHIEYYIKAYATNSVGTAYGNEVNFTTGTVIDYDGNTYNTVQIGNQVWMAENLATTRYNDGTEIPNVTSNSEWSYSPAYCWYDNNETSYKDTYGALYNWSTVKTGKLCPEGWHVPSDDEWKELEMFLGMSQSDADESAIARGTDEGNKLKATIGWNSNGNGTDDYGFTALPGGSRSYYSGNFYGVGDKGYWWSSVELHSNTAWYRELRYYESQVRRGDDYKSYGFSVRCVRDY